MQSQPRAFIVAVLLFSSLAGACTRKQESMAPPRLLGMETISAPSVTGYDRLLSSWMQSGFRNKVVIHAGPRDGLAFVPEARMKAIKADLQAGARTPQGNLINADNYLFVASQLGLIRSVFWITPYDHLDYINAEPRVRAFLKNEASHFRPRDVDGMRYQDRCVSGQLAGVDVHICNPARLSGLTVEPALVVIDAEYFPLSASQKNTTGLGSMKDFFNFLALQGVRASATAVMSTPDLPAMRGYLVEEIVNILEDPSIISRKEPPDLWVRREEADTMLHAGVDKEAIHYLDSCSKSFPDDPYLLLMSSTAHAMLSGRSAALRAMAGLCAGRPALCGGIADTGALLRQSGDAAGSEEFLKKAVSLLPRLDRIRYEYAVSLHDGGKYAEAEQQAALLQDQPGYEVSAAFLSGDCAYALQKKEEAAGRYERAVKAYREAGTYRLSAREEESLARLRTLYEQRKDARGLAMLERMYAAE